MVHCARRHNGSGKIEKMDEVKVRHSGIEKTVKHRLKFESLKLEQDLHILRGNAIRVKTAHILYSVFHCSLLETVPKPLLAQIFTTYGELKA